MISRCPPRRLARSSHVDVSTSRRSTNHGTAGYDLGPPTARTAWGDSLTTSGPGGLPVRRVRQSILHAGRPVGLDLGYRSGRIVDQDVDVEPGRAQRPARAWSAVRSGRWSRDRGTHQHPSDRLHRTLRSGRTSAEPSPRLVPTTSAHSAAAWVTDSALASPGIRTPPQRSGPRPRKAWAARGAGRTLASRGRRRQRPPAPPAVVVVVVRPRPHRGGHEVLDCAVPATRAALDRLTWPAALAVDAVIAAAGVPGTPSRRRVLTAALHDRSPLDDVLGDLHPTLAGAARRGLRPPPPGTARSPVPR